MHSVAPSGRARCGCDHAGSIIVLRTVGRQLLAGGNIIDSLGNVGGVITDALDVLGAEQQMGAGGDVARVFHHVGQQLAEQRGVDRVDLLVAFADRVGHSRRPRGEGVEHFLELRERQFGQVLGPEDTITSSTSSMPGMLYRNSMICAVT